MIRYYLRLHQAYTHIYVYIYTGKNIYIFIEFVVNDAYMNGVHCT
jgi:hypothetical protein